MSIKLKIKCQSNVNNSVNYLLRMISTLAKNTSSVSPSPSLSSPILIGYLYGISASHIFIAYLHSVSLLHICVAYLYCVSALHIFIAHLYCIYVLHIYIANMYCICLLHIFIVYIFQENVNIYKKPLRFPS